MGSGHVHVQIYQRKAAFLFQVVKLPRACISLQFVNCRSGIGSLTSRNITQNDDQRHLLTVVVLLLLKIVMANLVVTV